MEKTDQFTDECVTISLERYEEMKYEVDRLKEANERLQEHNDKYAEKFIKPLFNIIGSEWEWQHIIDDIMEKYPINTEVSEYNVADMTKTIIWSVKIPSYRKEV